MRSSLTAQSLDQLFNTARTYNDWSDAPVSDTQIRQIYELMKWGPTSANASPARFVWVRSAEGKARLAALALGSNQEKIIKAPVTVIIGYDMAFADSLPKLFPARGAMMQEFFKDPQVAFATAFRNSTLQGAYLIIAARALGLDCGPMSGFDNAGVDAAFLAGTTIKSNFICLIGHGTEVNLYPRNPRFTFDEANTYA